MMFITSVVLLFFVLTISQGQERSGWAGYEEHAGLRGWLKFHATPADWRNAAASCLGEDAQLASPWSSAFTAAVSSLQARHGAPLTHSGLRATLPFLSGELPQSLDGNELVRCGVFLANGSTAEMACDRRLPYVCFASKPAADSRAWPGYKYEAELRGFLKLHTRPADWLAARATCHLEGAFLASPWSQQFSSAIQRLQSRPEGGEGAGAVFAGVHVLTSFSDGAYKYVQGEPVLFLSRSDLVRGERCGVLFANGTEGETACDRRLPFVCYAPLPPTDPASTPGTRTTSKPPTTAPTTSPTIPPTNPAVAPTTPTIPPTTPTTTPTTPTAAPTTPTIPPTTPTTPTTTPTTPTAAPTTPTIPPTTPTTTPPTSPIIPPTTAPTTLTIPPATPTTTTPTTPATSPTTVATTTPTPTSSSASTSEPKTSPTQTPAPSSAICRDMGLDTGYEWAEVTATCYKFHATGANWSAARDTCAGEGARLAVPDSDEEARHFVALLLANLRTGITGASFKGAVAVGIYYEDGVWVTLDGIPLEESGYSKWWPGWPLAESVARWAFMEHTGRLENYSAFITTPYICEAAPPLAELTTNAESALRITSDGERGTTRSL